MKKNRLYTHAIIALFTLATCITSCSSDSKDEPIQKAEPKRSVSYVINNGNGGGSTTAPTIVTNSQPLHMTISQKSSYTDSDGKMFTCEPKATISLKVATDTVRVKDLSALTSVIEKESTNTSTTGTNPSETKISQVFEVGGQEVAFDLGYEIYRYANAANQSIEMPYIRLNPAKYGAANTNPMTRSVPEVTSIRLIPVAATRGEVVNTTTMYKVSVSFNLDMQTKNTGKDETQPLAFETEFIGIVESTTELPDPTTSLSYHLDVLGGTSSTESPFAVTLGEEFSLEWLQESQYTYFSATELTGKTVSEEAKATIKIEVDKDILWANSVDDIEKVTESTPVKTKSGKNPSKHIIRQSYDIGGKTINVEGSYEAFGKTTINGKEVELPYLELSPVEVVSVSKDEISATEVSAKAAKAYAVTVTLRQSLKGKNTSNELAETVEYVVEFIAAVEAKLISTTYEKDYQWVGPWCNLPWGYQYIVRRVRTYSTGEKETDEFILPTGNMALAESWTHHDIEAEGQLGPLHVIYHKANDYNNLFDENINEFRGITTTKTGVSDINLLKITTEIKDWNLRDINDYNMYEMIHSDKFFNPSSAEENWYVYAFSQERTLNIMYSEDEYLHITEGKVRFSYGEWFLYIDGKIIDFSEYRPIYDFNVKVEDTTLPDGSPAKVFTNEIKAKYLGKDFYAAYVDTVYQIK